MSRTFISSDDILDGTILNADVNSAAAIAGTKISPNFGTQNLIVDSSLLYVDAALQRVGVGVIPTERFHVRGTGIVGTFRFDSGPFAVGFEIESDDGPGHTKLTWRDAADVTRWTLTGRATGLVTTDSWILSHQNHSDRIVATGEGRVGIRTASPATDFDVAGNVQITGGGLTLSPSGNNDASGARRWISSGSFGNVHVGWELNDGVGVRIRGASGTPRSQALLFVDDATPRALMGFDDTSADFQFRIGADQFNTGSEAFRVTSSGLFKIGTTSGTERLSVGGNVEATGSFSSGPFGAANIFINGAGVSYFIGSTTLGIGNATPGALLGVGNPTSAFRVDTAGNLTQVRGVTYSWPSVQGAANAQLTNDGAGNLTWSTTIGNVSGTGVSGRVAFWNGTTSIDSSNLFTWDGTNFQVGSSSFLRLSTGGSLTLDRSGVGAATWTVTSNVSLIKQASTGRFEFEAGGQTSYLVGSNLLLGDVNSANATSRLIAKHVNGADSTEFVAKIINEDVTGGQGMGLLVQAGNNSSDVILHATSRIGTSFLYVRGDGATTIGDNGFIGTVPRGLTVNSNTASSAAGDTILAVTDNNFATLRIATSSGNAIQLGVNDSQFLLLGSKDSVSGTFTEYVRIDTTTSPEGFVANEQGRDQDFRVEGDTDTHLIFADASTDFVGIGVGAPLNKLHVQDAGATVRVQTTNTSNPGVNLHNSAGVLKFSLGYHPVDDYGFIGYGGVAHLFVDPSGNVGVGVDPITKFHVQGGSILARSADSSAGTVMLNLQRADTQVGLLVQNSDSGALSSLAVMSVGSASGRSAVFTGSIGVNGVSAPTQAIQVAGNVAPEASGTRDLGTSSLRWANIYLASNIDYSSDLTFSSGGERVRFTTSGSVGIGLTPHASAIFDIATTTQGSRPAPSMTMAQRDAISSPATGLLIYQTDNTPGYYFYNGTAWTTMGGGGGGHTIKDEGTPLTQRAGLNFVGSGVTVTDDAGNNETDVTIHGNTQIRQSFVATNGQTVFTLSTPYVMGGTNLEVYRNGALQKPGATFDYVETSTTVFTFNNGCTTGDTIEAKYMVPSTVILQSTPGTELRQAFTALGGAQTFTLTGGATYLNNGTNLKVYVNGSLQKPTTNYSEDNTTQFTFTTGLTAGDNVEAVWTQAATGVISYTPATQFSRTVIATGTESGLFTIPDSLTFVQGGDALKVYVDGVKQLLGGSNDYTEPSNSQVQFNSGNHPTAGQKVTFEAISQVGQLGLMQNRHDNQIATAGQTVFSVPWSFVMGGSDLAVFYNGQLMRRGEQSAGADYYEINNTQVVFYTGRIAGSVVGFRGQTQAAAGDANSVNGISASITPTAGKLVPLNGEGIFPAEALTYAILAAL